MKIDRPASFKNLADLKFNDVFLYAMIFSAVVCPGLLAFYVYKHELFINLDVTKLVLLALAIGSPLFGWSLF